MTNITSMGKKMQKLSTRLAPLWLATSILVVTACSSDDNKNPIPETENRELFSEGELAKELEEIRAKNNLPALAAFVVHGDGLVEKAAVGERSVGSGIEVTTDDMGKYGS